MIILAEEIVLEEGAIEEAGVREAIHIMEAESRKEPGCLTYAFSIDITDATIMRIYECWESVEALKAHFYTPHMGYFSSSIRWHSTKINGYEGVSDRKRVRFRKLIEKPYYARHSKSKFYQ